MRNTHNLLKELYDELKESFAADTCPIVDWACARIYDEIGDDLPLERARPCDVAAYDEHPLNPARDADKPAVLAALARRDAAEQARKAARTGARIPMIEYGDTLSYYPSEYYTPDTVGECTGVCFGRSSSDVQKIGYVMQFGESWKWTLRRFGSMNFQGDFPSRSEAATALIRSVHPDWKGVAP